MKKLLLFAIFLPIIISSQTLTGRIVRVSDGGTRCFIG